MVEYRADYMTDRDGEKHYIALFRLDHARLVPEEYLEGEWKWAERAVEAFWEGDIGDELIHYPDKLTLEQAEALIKEWEAARHDQA